MNRHLTLTMEAMTSFMNIKDYKVKGYAFTPEMRYWLSARPQAGHFIGLMGVAADYDLTHKQCHHDGDALGVGLTCAGQALESRTHRRCRFPASQGEIL